MVGFPGGTELLLIFGIVVLVFGASKLPKLGGAVGESIKNFRRSIRDIQPDELPEGSDTGSQSAESTKAAAESRNEA